MKDAEQFAAELASHNGDDFGQSFAEVLFREALTQTLHWTHEKPKNGGLYLLRECPSTTPTLHHLHVEDGGEIQVLNPDSGWTGDYVNSISDDYEWYGPIPWE